MNLITIGWKVQQVAECINKTEMCLFGVLSPRTCLTSGSTVLKFSMFICSCCEFFQDSEKRQFELLELSFAKLLTVLNSVPGNAIFFNGSS